MIKTWDPGNVPTHDGVAANATAIFFACPPAEIGRLRSADSTLKDDDPRVHGKSLGIWRTGGSLGLAFSTFVGTEGIAAFQMSRTGEITLWQLLRFSDADVCFGGATRWMRGGGLFSPGQEARKTYHFYYYRYPQGLGDHVKPLFAMATREAGDPCSTHPGLESFGQAGERSWTEFVLPHMSAAHARGEELSFPHAKDQFIRDLIRPHVSKESRLVYRGDTLTYYSKHLLSKAAADWTLSLPDTSAKVLVGDLHLIPSRDPIGIKRVPGTRELELQYLGNALALINLLRSQLGDKRCWI
jgi:hypothetical protein